MLSRLYLINNPNVIVREKFSLMMVWRESWYACGDPGGVDMRMFSWVVMVMGYNGDVDIDGGDVGDVVVGGDLLLLSMPGDVRCPHKICKMMIYGMR